MFDYLYSILPITTFQLIIANPFYSLPILLGTSLCVIIFLSHTEWKEWLSDAVVWLGRGPHRRYLLK